MPVVVVGGVTETASKRLASVPLGLSQNDFGKSYKKKIPFLIVFLIQVILNTLYIFVSK